MYWSLIFDLDDESKNILAWQTACHLPIRIPFSLVLNSLSGAMKKMTFFVEDQGKFEEFPGLYFYLIHPKSEQKKCTIFAKKRFIFLDTIFDTPYNFFLHFYTLLIS